MLQFRTKFEWSVAMLARKMSETPYYLTRTTILRNKHTDKNDSRSDMKGQQLSGVRILDMTRVLAGPYCTMVLGDLGAEILKVEKPGTGDETRSWGPPFMGKESVYFLSVNRNKKSISVNFKNPAGKELIQELSKSCDVLLENYVPGKLDEMGLGYDTLSRLNPRLIYCSITGYGSDGPYAQRAGYDVVASGIGGLMHITGPEYNTRSMAISEASDRYEYDKYEIFPLEICHYKLDGDPCRVGVAMTDIATGLYAHGAIMAALLQRNTTGVGQKIECSLLSTQVAVMSHLAANYLNCQQTASRLGSAHTSIVPYQAFKTSDGSLIIGAGNNKHFKTLCKVLGLDYLIENPLYADNRARVENRKELLEVLKNRFEQKSTREWLELLECTNIPCGPINNMEQVFDDPQVKHKNLVQSIQHKTVGKISVVGPAVEYSGVQPAVQPAPPPLLGEHTIDVLQNVLGYSEETIRSLQECHAI